MAGQPPEKSDPNIPSNASIVRAMTGTYVASKGFKAFKTAGDLGKEVRLARKSMGLTQQTFADLAGVGRRFVSELESGKPTLEFEKVIKVAHASGLDLFVSRRTEITQVTP